MLDCGWDWNAAISRHADDLTRRCRLKASFRGGASSCAQRRAKAGPRTLRFIPPAESANAFSVSELTVILQRIDQGDPTAAGEILPLVYEELRQLAGQKLAREHPGQTLQATALVHEAWLRLGGDDQPDWKNRAHFFAAAAEAMRRILIDNARRKSYLRHGGGKERVNFDDLELAAAMDDEQLLGLNEALDQLAEHDAQKAELVKLRFFTGLTNEQVAQVLGISEPTVKRHWAYARAWLFRRMQPHSL